MTKRVIIVHGWGGSPNNDWLPWAKRELEKKGYKGTIPAMPDTEHPKIETWVSYLAEVIGNPDENLTLIGHSVGCQTILRYLSGINQKVNKVILVAPWGSALSNLADNEEEKVARPWLETPIDFEKAREKADKFIAIFSDDDPFVPLKENLHVFKERLGAEIIVESRKGHFTESDGVKELPILLDLIKSAVG